MPEDDVWELASSIPGRMQALDATVLLAVHRAQRTAGMSGSILEIGAYLGRSAAVLGGFVNGRDERLYVCDLFEEPARDAANASEQQEWYPHLRRRTFESNYLTVHDGLPTILQVDSRTLLDHALEDGAFRIVHIDGSHGHDVVRTDIATAKRLLVEHGVVVVDDYRSFWIPGVAHAVWTEIVAGGLRLLCVTPQKIYGTWGDSRSEAGNALRGLLAEQPGIETKEVDIDGATIVAVRDRDALRAGIRYQRDASKHEADRRGAT